MTDLPQVQHQRHFEYCSYSNTVRLMPENYMVTFHHGGKWVCDPDTGMPYRLRMDVFSTMTTSHNLRWGSGEDLAAALNKIPREIIHC